MTRLQVLLGLTLVGAASCAEYGGSGLLKVPTLVIAPRGFAMAAPDAIRMPSGTRFHGSVCRKDTGPSLTAVRLERVAASGEILASASHSVSGLHSRTNHCAVYDVETDWEIGPGDHVNVCASRSGSSCPAAK